MNSSFQSYHLRVIIPVTMPDSLLKETIECDIVAVHFNIGINEYATLAET